jgi:hypothetical protein
MWRSWNPVLMVRRAERNRAAPRTFQNKNPHSTAFPHQHSHQHPPTTMRVGNGSLGQK